MSEMMKQVRAAFREGFLNGACLTEAAYDPRDFVGQYWLSSNAAKGLRLAPNDDPGDFSGRNRNSVTFPIDGGVTPSL